jgi:hypothetical protein
MGITVNLTEEEEKGCLAGLALVLKHKNTSTVKELSELEDLYDLTISQKACLVTDKSFIKEIVSGDNPRNFILTKEEIPKVHNKEIPVAFYVSLGFTFADIIDCLFKPAFRFQFDETFKKDMMKLVLETYEERDSNKLYTFIECLSDNVFESISFSLLELDDKYEVLRNRKLLDLVSDSGFFEYKPIFNRITTKYEDECDMGMILSLDFINRYDCDLDLLGTLLAKGYVPNNKMNILCESMDPHLLRKVLDLYYKYIDPEVIYTDLVRMLSTSGEYNIEICNCFLILEYLGRYSDVSAVIAQVLSTREVL